MNFREEIIVFCGPMRAGKSNSLLIHLDKLKYANIPYIIFKPNIDRHSEVIATRYSYGNSAQAISIDINNPKSIFDHIDLNSVKLPFTVAIDEAQFFGDEIVDVINDLHAKGINLVIAGLDQDANGRAFGPMGSILAIATKVKKLTAVCEHCHDESTKTGLVDSDPDFEKSNIKIDASNYVSLCSRCYYKNKLKIR